jgi:hypothetical protein
LVALDNSTCFYFDKLQNASFTRFTDQVNSFLEQDKVGPALKELLVTYASEFSVDTAFTKQGISLTEKEVRKYDTGIRYFLDSSRTREEEGFYSMLKRYVFSRIVNQTDSVLTIANHIRLALNLQISHRSPEYNNFAAIRILCANDQIENIVMSVAEHIKNGGSVSPWGNYYKSLTSFIFNLYLIDYKIPAGESLYRMAMSTRPGVLIQDLRRELHSSTTEL